MTELSTVASAMSEYKEVNYDMKPTQLYKLIEKQNWGEVVSRCESNPDEVSTWIIRRDSEGGIRWKILPIHAALIFQGGITAIEKILSIFPDGTTMTDDQGMLPLHLAFRNDVSDEVINILLSLSPEAIGTKDRKNRTPLDHVPSKKTSNKDRQINQFRLLASEMARRVSTLNTGNSGSEGNIKGQYEKLMKNNETLQGEFENMFQGNKAKTASLIKNKMFLEDKIEALERKCMGLKVAKAELKLTTLSINCEEEEIALNCEDLIRTERRVEELEIENAKLQDQNFSLGANLLIYEEGSVLTVGETDILKLRIENTELKRNLLCKTTELEQTKMLHELDLKTKAGELEDAENEHRAVMSGATMKHKKECAFQKAQINELTEKENTLEEHLQKMLRQEEAMIKTYDRFEDFNEESRGKLTELMQRNESNRNKVAELTTKKNLLELKLGDKDSKHAVMAASCEELEKRVQTLMERLDDARTENRSYLGEITVLKDRNNIFESDERTHNENDDMKKSCEDLCNLTKSLTEKLESLKFEHTNLKNEMMVRKESTASIEGDLKRSEEEVDIKTETNENLCKKIEELKNHHSIEKESNKVKIHNLKDLETELKCQMKCQYEHHKKAIQEMKELGSTLEKDYQSQIKHQEIANEEAVKHIKDKNSGANKEFQTRIIETEETHKKVIQEITDKAFASEENLKLELRKLEESCRDMKDHKKMLDGNLQFKSDKESEYIDTMKVLSKQVDEHNDTIKKLEKRNASLETSITSSMEREKTSENSVMEYDSINTSNQDQVKHLREENEINNKLVNELGKERDIFLQTLKSTSENEEALKESCNKYNKNISILQEGQSDADDEINTLKLRIIDMEGEHSVIMSKLHLSMDGKKVLLSSVDECKMQVSILEGEVSTLKSENQCRDDLIQSVNIRSSSIEEEANAIKLQEEVLRNMSENLKLEIEELSKEAAIAEARKKKDANIIIDLQMKLKENAGILANKENEVEKVGEEHASLTANYKAQMDEFKEQKVRQFNDLKSQELLSKENFEAENKRLKDEIADLTEENNLYGKKVEELSSLIINVQQTTGNEKSKLNEAIQKMNKEIFEHKITSESASKDKYLYHKNIDNLKEKLEAEQIESSILRERFEEIKDTYMTLQESASEVRGASSGTILGLKEAVDMWRKSVTNLEDQLVLKCEKEESHFTQLREISSELVESREAHANTTDELHIATRNNKLLSIELERNIDVMKEEYESAIDIQDNANEDLIDTYEGRMDTMKTEHLQQVQLMEDAKRMLAAQYEAQQAQFEEEKENMMKEHEDDVLKLITANSCMTAKFDKQMEVITKDHKNDLQAIKGANENMTANLEKNIDTMKIEYECAIHNLESANIDLMAQHDKHLIDMNKIVSTEFEEEMENIMEDQEEELYRLKIKNSASVAELEDKIDDLRIGHEKQLQMMKDAESESSSEFTNQMVNMRREHNQDVKVAKNACNDTVDHLQSQLKKMARQHDMQVNRLKLSNKVASTLRGYEDHPVIMKSERLVSLPSKDLGMQSDRESCEQIPGADLPEKRAGMMPTENSDRSTPGGDTFRSRFSLRSEGNTFPPNKEEREPLHFSRSSLRTAVSSSEADLEMS